MRAPPAALRDRILASVDATAPVFIDPQEGIWLPRVDSPVSVRELYCDSGDRMTTRQLRMAAGERLPSGPFAGHRLVAVLAGSLQSAAGDLIVGDCLLTSALGDSVVARTASTVLDFVTAGAAPEQELVIRPGGATWHPAGPGISLRPVLSGSSAAGQLLAVQSQPNATLAEHHHDAVEELFVLHGSCEVEGHRMVEGSYHRAPPGSHHRATVAGEAGCLLLCSVRPLA